jgi:hypothetical protein
MKTRLQVKCLLFPSYFNEIIILLIDFRKIFKFGFHPNPFSGAPSYCMQPDGQRGVKRLEVACRNFVNVPENGWKIFTSSIHCMQIWAPKTRYETTSVIIVTKLQVGRPRYMGSIPSRSKVSLLHRVNNCCGAHPAYFRMRNGGL